MFCPKCKSEYRKGFDRCAECNIPLVEKEEVVNPESDLESIFQTKDSSLLEKILVRLEAKKIPYLVQAGTAFNSRLAWQGVLYVPYSEADKTIRMIELIERDHSNPAHRECPYCRNVIQTEEDVISCDNCKTDHHLECWHEKEGCSVYGCLGQTGQVL